MKNKKGVSEMIAYVILISIALGLAAAVYAWLVYIPPLIKPPIDCKQGTTISLESYSCDSGEETITLAIKNNGRFNIDGIIVKFGDNASKEPISMLNPDYSAGSPAPPIPGHFSFNLTAGEIQDAKFKRIPSYNPSEGMVKIIQIQPFVLDNRKKITCIGAVIRQLLNDPECKIKVVP